MKRFRGGVVLTEGYREKQAAATQQPRRLSPSAVFVSLCTNGVTMEPCVTAGQHVRIGEALANDPAGFVPPLHSGLSGTVRTVDLLHPSVEGGRVPTLVIDNDGGHAAALLPPLPENASPDEIVHRMYEAGLVGLGGGGYPTHRKYRDLTARWLLINACECEPYLAADAGAARHFLPLITEGVAWLSRAARVDKARVHLCTESENTAALLRPSGWSVALLPKRYPQGSERQLIEAVLGNRLPDGVLPTAAGIVVSNLSTAAAMGDAARGLPLTHRMVTVSGCITEPYNVLAPIGTRVADLCEAAKRPSPHARVRYLAGGPMTGRRLHSLDVGISKTCTGVTILPSQKFSETPCIRCGACARACPSSLVPFLIEQAAFRGEDERCRALRAAACISCGCCSFVCPAKRNLAARVTAAKRKIKEQDV